MSEFITKIRTSEGDKQIDYNALGNKPQFKMPSAGEDGVVLTDKTTGYEAQKTDGEHIGTLTINNEEHKLYTSKTFTLETDAENNKTYKPVLSGDDGWKYVVSNDNKDVMCVGDGNGNVGGLRLSSASEGHGDLYQADVTEDVVHYLPATGGTLLNDQTVGSALANFGLTGITTEKPDKVYTANVPGITALVAGANFIMIPHETIDYDDKLDVNGLGEKEIKRYVSSHTSDSNVTRGYHSTWLGKGKPVRMMYDGTCWIVENLTLTTLDDINNSDHTTKLSIAKGGTGAGTKEKACENLGIVDLIYPVGSIYISLNDQNPAELFGKGTWERIQDRFLLAASDTYAAGSTGGKATHSQVYDGIAYEIRKDKCVYTKNTKKENLFAETETTDGNNWISTAKYSTAYGDYSSNTTEVSQTGLSTQTKVAMDIMPPYLTVYMWQRIS